jgi:hypothetical protein
MFQLKMMKGIPDWGAFFYLMDTLQCFQIKQKILLAEFTILLAIF